MFRYPDKPAAQIDGSALVEIPASYIAQLKLDGWRCVVERTETGLEFVSRHKKPIPISAQLSGDLGDMLADLPVGTMLDGEWVGRRPSCKQESLLLFDVMQLGDLGLWTEPTEARLALLRGLVPEQLVVPHVAGDYDGFWRDVMGRPDAEGVVLKLRAAKYIGSFRGSALNPGWLKAKWRAGEDGCTVLATA